MKHSANKDGIESILSDSRGVTAIEFAIMLPLFAVFVLGVIEFGLYFVKSGIADSAISNISLTLQRDPTYYQQMSQTSLNKMLSSYGSGLVKFTPIGTVLPSSKGNFICVDAYSTQAQAAAAGMCTSTHFNTASPNAPGTPYYVAVRSNLTKGGSTPLVNFIKNVQNIQVTQNTGALKVGNISPPSCNQPGQALQFDGTNWICVNILLPTCGQPWNKLVYSGGSFVCQNTPYIVAGGLAHPTANYGSSVGWIKDNSNAHWWDWPASYWPQYSWQYFTLCQQAKLNWTVPAGLPAGQIITEGNLMYPQASINVSWHAWSVSFLNLSVPMAGGNASTQVCMSHGGNFDLLDDIHAEYISWTATYLPNSSR